MKDHPYRKDQIATVAPRAGFWRKAWAAVRGVFVRRWWHRTAPIQRFYDLLFDPPEIRGRRERRVLRAKRAAAEEIENAEARVRALEDRQRQIVMLGATYTRMKAIAEDPERQPHETAHARVWLDEYRSFCLSEVLHHLDGGMLRSRPRPAPALTPMPPPPAEDFEIAGSILKMQHDRAVAEVERHRQGQRIPPPPRKPPKPGPPPKPISE